MTNKAEDRGVMTNKGDSGISSTGSILCFVIYVILCGQIVTILENQWLIIPPGLQVELTYEIADGNSIKVKSNSTEYGACGLVGMCYPYSTGVIIGSEAVNYDKCRLYENTGELGGQTGIIALSLYGVGLAAVAVAWLLSICSCRTEKVCGKNVYLLLTHFITLAFLLVGGGSVTWMFTWHTDNCAAVYCSAVPLFKHDCLFGWALWVLSSVICALFITMIVLCAITRRHLVAVKPKIRRLPIQVTERPGNNTGFMFARTAHETNHHQSQQQASAAVTVGHLPGTGHSTTSERSTTRFPRGGPGVYGSVRLKEFYF